MPQLKILTQPAYTQLWSDVIKVDRQADYRDTGSCGFLAAADRSELRQQTASALPLLSMHSTGASRASTDAANAIATYEYVGRLPPNLAAEPRVWASLCHGEFWAYARWRFAMPEAEDAMARHIRQHFFVSGSGLAALRRNAVARLWWASSLTVAPWDTDPECERFRKADRYHYTRVLLASQQVYQDVMEREFGSNLRLRISFLDALDEHRTAIRSLDNLVRESSKQLLVLLRFRHLLTLPVDDMRRACGEVVKFSMNNLEVAK